MYSSTSMLSDNPGTGRLANLLALAGKTLALLDRMAPVGDLVLRIWVSAAFFSSGLTKIASLETTVLLFQYEYQVPLLPPAVAAYLSIAGELGLPVLLALGLGGRIGALGLFILNIVAVLSYPGLMEAGLAWHKAWGLVLLIFVLRGPGRLSVDHFIRQRFTS